MDIVIVGVLGLLGVYVLVTVWHITRVIEHIDRVLARIADKLEQV